MNIYSNITIGNLEGFKCPIKGFMCGEFKIEKGHYIDISRKIDNKIGRLVVDKDGTIIYNQKEKILSILSAYIDEDIKILKFMLSYCIYNKRKSIIESL